MRAGTVAFVLSLAVMLAAGPADARKIYKWVLPDGSITYSDKPQQEGAKELVLPSLQTYTPPPAPAGTGAAGTADAGKQAVSYESIKVVAPQPDETIRDNNGAVSVRLELTPPLQAGHSVEILLDGKAIGSGAATSASVTNIDRGSHSVSAVVKDASGKVLANAAGVTFHLKQASKLQGGPAVAPPKPTPKP